MEFLLMQVRVYLHGHLRDKIGKDSLILEGVTPRDVLAQISNRYHKELKAPLDVGKWKIRVKGYETKESLFAPIYTDELHIYPIFRTAKSKWVTIGIGIALIVAAPYASAALAGTAFGGLTVYGSTTVASAVGGAMFWTGVSLTATGVLSLFMSQPKLNTSLEETTNSKYLGTGQNTTKVGTRIPFGYGLYKVAGHYISYNISSTVMRTFDFNNSDT